MGLTSIAATVTGLAVAGGVLAESPVKAELAASGLAQVAQGAAQAPGRDAIVSRSDRRAPADEAKAAALSADAGPATTQRVDLSDADPRVIAAALLGEFGFSDSQFGCLNALYISESDWRVDADNPTSSAYGIPQALTQLHDLPEGYMTSAEVQIRWGLGYIRDNYGTPCSAWEFKAGHGWY